MIRMGRSSKNEETSNETTAFQEQPETTNFPYTNESQPKSTRAISESESMARDIKEGRLSGFVGAGTVLTGETNFDSMLRVDGHLTGRVSSDQGTLIVGSTGQVDANIEVSAAMVNGMVNGDIVASEKLELGRTARVVGNISAPRLLIEDGAILEGNCSMVKSKENMEQRAIEQQKQYTTGGLTSEPVTDVAKDTDEISDSSIETDETDSDSEEEIADAATN